MSWTEAAFVFRGATGRPETHTLTSVVRDVGDAAKAVTLRDALDLTSNCIIVQNAFNSVTMTEPDPGDIDGNVDRRATLHFKHSLTGRVTRITIPDPVATYDGSPFTETTSNGERVTLEGMEKVAALLNAATGASYIPLYGVITQKA